MQNGFLYIGMLRNRKKRSLITELPVQNASHGVEPWFSVCQQLKPSSIHKKMKYIWKIKVQNACHGVEP